MKHIYMERGKKGYTILHIVLWSLFDFMAKLLLYHFRDNFELSQGSYLSFFDKC